MLNAKTSFGLLSAAVLVLSCCGTLPGFSPSGEVIGMATADGRMQVNGSSVWGSSTVFEGNTLETVTASIDLRLNSGALFRLAAQTRATVHRNKVFLQAGRSELKTGEGFEVQARSLRIVTTLPETQARVWLKGGAGVTVAAVRGALKVANAEGFVIANVPAGASLDLEPQHGAGAEAATQGTGCLLARGGKLILVEETTKVVLELEGPGVAEELGNHVTIRGSAGPRTGPSQVVKVVAITRVSKGGCSKVAKEVGALTAAAGSATAVSGSTGAATTGAASAGAGAAGGATVAGVGVGTITVVGGVAAAATIGGLAATGSLPGQSENQPSASR